MNLRSTVFAALAGAAASLSAHSAEPVKLDLGQGTTIRFTTPPPALWDGERLPEPVFDRDGNARVNGLTLKRTIAKFQDGYRIRLAVTNARTRPIELRSLVPVQVTGQQNMLVADTPLGSWKIFRLARHKNDIPGPFRPAKLDDASRDAGVDSSGGTHNDEPGETKPAGGRFHSDPGFVVMPDGKPDSTHLFIGFDGQTAHLNDVRVDLGGGLAKLEKLAAIAEFDGVIVPPGGTRETHDLYIQTGKGREALLASHVERIKRRYGARLPDKRNVFCTWYFYGPEIVADDLRKDLAAMKRRRVKFDMFLIDYGWSDRYGDWNADRERFPQGMDGMAREIGAAGLSPGIWSAPFLMDPKAEVLKQYPDLLLKNRAGENLRFGVGDLGNWYVIDPTAPSAERFLAELAGKLTGWGYRYLKFDFMRSVAIYEDAVFHDRTVNRAQAYRRGIEILRKAAGNSVTFGFWGGLYEASAGIVDINRSGSDVRGHWDPVANGSYSTRYPVRMRQTFARAFYDDGKLWMSDQDALQLRRRTQPWRRTKVHISMGTFTDEEAFSMVVYRFLGGGIVQVSEKLDELDQDRYDLYKAVIPTYAPVPKVFGAWDEYLPEYFVSHFSGHGDLPPWAVVSLCNWNGKARSGFAFRIADVPGLSKSDRYAAFEFRTQKLLGVFRPQDTIRLDLDAHAARVIRLTPIRGDGTYLVGTDLNLSCGMEIQALDGKKVTLKPEVREFPARFTFLKLMNGAQSMEVVSANH